MLTNHVLLVAVGGAVGSVCRFLVGALTLRWFGPNFPWGTVAVNVAGSFAMGLFIAWLTARGGSAELRIFVATGFLGGFTTLSAFSLDTAVLIERGAPVAAAAYVVGTVAVSISALFAGLFIARSLS